MGVGVPDFETATRCFTNGGSIGESARAAVGPTLLTAGELPPIECSVCPCLSQRLLPVDQALGILGLGPRVAGPTLPASVLPRIGS